jgi:hypothetical protein
MWILHRCSAYDNELDDSELTAFLEKIDNMMKTMNTNNLLFYDKNIDFLSAPKFVVNQYKLSDVINFFIKIKLDRLIILDLSCSCINEKLDERSRRRAVRGGMSKKQRSKTQKRKKNKTRRNKK